MRTEGFAVSGEDLGDIYPRKVHFYPETGRVRVKKLMSTRNDTIFARERNYLQQVSTTPQTGDVELF
jgi:chemotaxis protein CheD